MTNARHLRGSAWLNFQRVTCEQWSHFNGRAHVVLMGDAVHTAHFAIGSGTKLAIEDAIELTRQFKELGDTPRAHPRGAAALPGAAPRRRAAPAERRLERDGMVRGRRPALCRPAAARAVHVLDADAQPAHQPREPAPARQGLARRLRALVRRTRRACSLPAHVPAPPPMFTPYTLRSVTLKNRVVVSPMAQYCCVDGLPGDFHLVHLGARALGGAGHGGRRDDLHLAPTRASRPAARGCGTRRSAMPGSASSTVVHRQSDAKIALQIGHAGPKGSTNAPWDADRRRPAAARRQLAAARRVGAALPGRRRRAARDDPRRHGPRARRLRAQRALRRRGRLRLARAALRARLPAVSSFISPLTNRRSDDYGGTLANRLRYPLEVFAAVREAWPKHLPMSVRISAHDWVEGGITPDDAVEIARAFKAAGADMIDCSSGQVSARAEAHLRPHVPDALCRPHPQRGRHRHHRGGRHLRGRPRQQHHRRRPRRPVRHRAAAPGQPGLDADRGGQDRLHADALAEAVPGRQERRWRRCSRARRRCSAAAGRTRSRA